MDDPTVLSAILWVDKLAEESSDPTSLLRFDTVRAEPASTSMSELVMVTDSQTAE